MNNGKIVERISKLMQVTVENGASKEEAIAAAKMAQRLLAKYNVSSVEIDAHENKDDIGEENIDYKGRWESHLVHVVAKCFRCEPITYRYAKRVYFMGHTVDRMTAAKTAKALLAIGRKGLKETRKKCLEQYGTTEGVTSSYGYAFCDAVENELRKQARALVLVTPDDVKEKYAREYPDVVTARPSYYSPNNYAMGRGRTDGQSAAGRRVIRA